MGNTNANTEKIREPQPLQCDDFVGLMQSETKPGTCWFDSMVTALFLNDTMRELITIRHSKMSKFIQEQISDDTLKFELGSILIRIEDLMGITEAYRYMVEEGVSDEYHIPGVKRNICINIGRSILELLKKIPQINSKKELKHFAKLFDILQNDFQIRQLAFLAKNATTGNSGYLLLFVIAVLNFPFHLEYLRSHQTHEDLIEELRYNKKCIDEEILLISTPPHSEKWSEDRHIFFKYFPKILEVGKHKYIANIISYAGCSHAISAFLCGNAWYVYDNNRAFDRKYIARVRRDFDWEPEGILQSTFDTLNKIMDDRYCNKKIVFMNVIIFYIRDDLIIKTQENLRKSRKHSIYELKSGGRRKKNDKN